MTPRSLVLAAALCVSPLCVSTAASGFAQNAPQAMDGPAARTKATLLLNPEALKPQFLLPPPPADDSVQTKAELAETRAAVANATPQQHALAQHDNDTENATFFADTVQGFDLTRLPATKKLFAEVRAEESAEAKTAKTWFARHRPFQLDASFPTCEAKGTAPTSYPSGHATMGYSMGVVLARLVPEKASAIMSRARLYAENRLVCGVHYRSDLIAGETLGTTVAVLLLQEPKFQQDMTAAHAELVMAGVARGQ